MYACAYTKCVAHRADPAEARTNATKYRIPCGDAVAVLEDERASCIRDPFSNQEERWITVGQDAFGRVLFVVHSWRDLRTPSDAAGAQGVYGESVKQEYDFSKGKRGPVVPEPKTT